MDDIREGGVSLRASNRKAYELSVLNAVLPLQRVRCLRMQSGDSHMLRFSESPTNTGLFPLNALGIFFPSSLKEKCYGRILQKDVCVRQGGSMTSQSRERASERDGNSDDTRASNRKRGFCYWSIQMLL
ncbi:hypothetical protein BHE74_00049417 [Ensete ventricosum]|nr:hypothetical protein BHE74_00049417 [Ensete ventricosum]